MKVQCRWLVQRDFDEGIQEIESQLGDLRLPVNHLINFLRTRNCDGLVAEDEDFRVLGYAVYELCNPFCRVLRLAVDEKYRREGVGRALIAKLKSKLSESRRPFLEFMVPERALDLQLFLKSQNFVAIGIGEPDNNGNTSYLMEYRLPGTEPWLAEEEIDEAFSEGANGDSWG